MKVYRMTVDGTGKIEGNPRSVKSALESLYYEMGYILTGNQNHGGSNNISYRIAKNDTGHYYFIFLEDALHYAIYKTHPSANLKVMEFDFPEDIVYSLIGWGSYYRTGGYYYDKRVETYISDSKIAGEHILSTSIDESEKRKVFLNAFRRCNNALKDYYKNHSYKIEYAYFNEKIEKALELSDEELFNNFIHTEEYDDMSYYMYQRFTWLTDNYGIKNEYDLIKTPTITNKSSPFLFNLFSDCRAPEIEGYNAELLSKNGFQLDYSMSGIDCRIDYTKMIEKGDYESAKRLLKSYRG